MTEIVTPAIATPRVRFPRFGISPAGIGAFLCTIPRAIAQAYDMAYVDPYRGRRQTPAPDGECDGRDPGW